MTLWGLSISRKADGKRLQKLIAWIFNGHLYGALHAFQMSWTANNSALRCLFRPHFLMAWIRILRRDCASSQRALRRLTCRNMRQRPTSVLLRFMSTTLSLTEMPLYA